MANRLDVGVLLLGGIVLLALLPKKPAAPAPPAAVPEPVWPELGGPATVSGSLHIVQVAQAVSKQYGSMIRVDGTWEGTTRDAQGALIPWLYRIVPLLGHNTVFGWKTAGQLGWPGSDPTVTEYPNSSGPQTFTKFFATPADPNQTWDIHVRLESLLDNDRDGRPDGNWTLLVEDERNGAVVSVPPPSAASVSGTLTITSVSQRSIGRFGL